jgi:hypothetical protein
VFFSALSMISAVNSSSPVAGAAHNSCTDRQEVGMKPFNVIARVKNMTRETKLGLLVSCSFLSLLVAVLGMKMTERTEENAGQEVAAADPGETPRAEKSVAVPPAAPAADPPTPPALPKGIQNAPIVQTGGTSSSQGTNGKPADTGLPLLPPAPGADAKLTFNSKAGEKSSSAGTGDGLPPIPAAPATPAPVVTTDPSKPAPPGGGGVLAGAWSHVRLPAGLAAKKNQNTDGDGKNGNKPLARGNDGPPPIPAPGKPGGGSLPDLPPIAAPVETKDTPAVPPPLPRVEQPSTGPKPAVAGGTASPATPLRPVPATPLAPVALPDRGHTTQPPATGAKPTFAQDTGKTPTIDVGNISGGTSGRASAPTTPAKEPEPIPVGRPPSAAVPPVPVAASPTRQSAPDVVSYTEETYVANAGDSYQSISRAKYGTESYAHALYLFNRSHPLAGEEVSKGENVKPRQSIYLPPAEILQNRYAEAVGGAKTGAASGVSVGTTSQRAGTALRGYRVAAGGEKLYDIAARLLGDGNRWVEIRDQNPGWNPALPIPGGTTLTVPGEARLAQ